MVVNTKGNERMICCLLDMGCWKSIVVKKVIDKKQKSKFSKEEIVRYTTYGGKFVSTETATLSIRLVEFGEEISSNDF